MRRAAHNGCCRRVAQTRALCSILWKLLVAEDLTEALINIEAPLVNSLFLSDLISKLVLLMWDSRSNNSMSTTQLEIADSILMVFLESDKISIMNHWIILFDSDCFPPLHNSY